MLVKQAWRNIWRNKRRTIITMASVAFALFFSVVQRGFHLGSWDMLLDSVMHSYTGYVQVHAKGYWDDRTLENTFEESDSFKRKILNNNSIKDVVPRLESFALISAKDKTKPVIVAGIDAEAERRFTRLDNKLISGKLLADGDTAAVISNRLAKFLGVWVGDTIVLLGQGYHGVSAAGIYRVKGIVKLPAPEWDNQMVYLPLPVARHLYSSEDKITSLVLEIDDARKVDQITQELRADLDLKTYEVMSWKEMLKELYQQYVLDIAGGLILLAILYLVVGFGIFGTVLMMTSERVHEFAVMLAIGTSHSRLRTIIVLEMLLIAALGVLVGMLLSGPVLTYYHFHPIQFTGEYAKTMESYGMEPVMPVLWKMYYIFNQGFAIFAMTFVAIIYPLIHVRRLNIVKSLKS